MTSATDSVRDRTSGRPRLPESTSVLLILLYAAGVYVFFLVVLGYAIGFFADFGVPKNIDEGTRSAWPAAASIDAALLLLFAAQHTVMARPWFKRAWTRLVPAPAERATFVLCASLVLALVFWLWRPVHATVWDLTGPGAAALTALYAAGWVVAISSTFMVSHGDLFGLRQACLHARRAGYRPPPFTQRGFYRIVRHPLMTGFLIVFWAAPVMTAGHLLFAAAATGYILVGITFEEHDLDREFGAAYGSYRDRVPALIPALRRPGRRRSALAEEGVDRYGGRHGQQPLGGEAADDDLPAWPFGEQGPQLVPATSDVTAQLGEGVGALQPNFGNAAGYRPPRQNLLLSATFHRW